jgi:hypothetical protein
VLIVEAPAGEAGLPVECQGDVGQPGQPSGRAGGRGMSGEQVRVEVGPGEGRGDGLDDPGVGGRPGQGEVEDLLGASECPGDRGVADAEVDDPEPAQLDREAGQVGPRPVGAGEETLDREVEGVGDPEDLLQGGQPGPGLDVGDLLLGEPAACRQGRLAQPGLGPGRSPHGMACSIPHFTTLRCCLQRHVVSRPPGEPFLSEGKVGPHEREGPAISRRGVQRGKAHAAT